MFSCAGGKADQARPRPTKNQAARFWSTWQDPEAKEVAWLNYMNALNIESELTIRSLGDSNIHEERAGPVKGGVRSGMRGVNTRDKHMNENTESDYL